MSIINPFAPRKDQTKTLSAGTTTANVQVLDNATSSSNWNAYIYNAGTVAAYISWGGASVTASTSNGLPIPPGTFQVLTLNGAYIAAITASGTATLYITEGSGI